MRKIRLLLLIALPFFMALVLGVFVVASANIGWRSFKLPKGVVKVADGVYYLGRSDGADGYAFVHPKKGYHHKPGHGNGGGGNGGTPTSKCYAFLANGARWKATEAYVLDEANASGMAADYVASITSTSLETWDGEVGFDIFGTRDLSALVDGVDTSSPDGKNEVLFGDISDPGAIAVTTVWGYFYGPPSTRSLIEWDAIYDDVDFTWGDATLDPTVMDYWNIAAHEFGHAAGMGHPSDTCAEETMYRFGATGETKKRDLNTGDINGIKALYK